MGTPKDKWDLGTKTAEMLGLKSSKAPKVKKPLEMADPDDVEVKRKNMKELMERRKGGRVGSIMSGGGLG